MKRIIEAAMLSTALLSLAPASHAAIISYQAILSGAAENPANLSPGTGSFTVDYDNVAHTLAISGSFSGLTGNVTTAHIHCCTVSPNNAGVATTTPTFAGFPSGVTSGTYMNTLDLTLSSSFNPAFVTASGGTLASAEATLVAGLGGQQAYFNIHTTAFPGGEIRGFLAPVPVGRVPEPAMLALFAAGLAGLSLCLCLRRRLRPQRI